MLLQDESMSTKIKVENAVLLLLAIIFCACVPLDLNIPTAILHSGFDTLRYRSLSVTATIISQNVRFHHAGLF